MKLDLYRRPDGALVVVPARFPQAVPRADVAALRHLRRVRMPLELLTDSFVLELGLQGFAVARAVDAALLRNSPRSVEDVAATTMLA